MDFLIDNSETTWLVYADWLDDQDKVGEHVREMVRNPEEPYAYFGDTNLWDEHEVGSFYSELVGSLYNESDVGGSPHIDVDPFFQGTSVGGGIWPYNTESPFDPFNCVGDSVLTPNSVPLNEQLRNLNEIAQQYTHPHLGTSNE